VWGAWGLWACALCVRSCVVCVESAASAGGCVCAALLAGAPAPVCVHAVAGWGALWRAVNHLWRVWDLVPVTHALFPTFQRYAGSADYAPGETTSDGSISGGTRIGKAAGGV
jgi:hypothetical protein